MLDEGVLLHVAERISDGEVLYRDIATGLAPGSYYLQALLFKVFGPGVLVGRYFMIILLASSGIVIFNIARMLVKLQFSLAASMLFVASQAYTWRFPNYTPESLFLMLLALLMFMRYLVNKKGSHLLLSALLVGICALFKQHLGAYAAIALFITLFIDHRYSLRHRSKQGANGRCIGKNVSQGKAFVETANDTSKQSERAVGPFVIAFFGVTAPFLLALVYFYYQDALVDMAYYGLVVPLKVATKDFYLPYPGLTWDFAGSAREYRSYGGAYTPLGNMTHWWLSERKLISLGEWFALVVAAYYLPITILLAAMLRLGLQALRRGIDVRWLKLFSLFIFSLMNFLGVFPRSDIHHLMLASGPVLVLGTVLIGEIQLRGLTKNILHLTLLVPILMLCTISITNAWSLRFHPDAVSRNSELLDFERGGVYVTADQYSAISDVLSYFETVNESDPLLVIPIHSMYYFLAQRRNPTPFPLILPGALDEVVVNSALASEDLRNVIYLDRTIDRRTTWNDFPSIYKELRGSYSLKEYPPYVTPGRNLHILTKGESGGELYKNYSYEDSIPLSRNLDVAVVLLDKLDYATKEVLGLNGSRRILPANQNRIEEDGWMFQRVLKEVPPNGAAKTAIEYPLCIEPGWALQFSIGLIPRVWRTGNGDGVFFEIYVHEQGKVQAGRLFSEYIDPKNREKDRKWHRFIVGLEDYAGKQVSLIFVTSGGPRFNMKHGIPDVGKDVAGWGEPELVRLADKKSIMTMGNMCKNAPVVTNPLTPEAVAGISAFDQEAVSKVFDVDVKRDFDTYYALARIHYYANRFSEAQKYIDLAVALEPGNYPARRLSLGINRKAGKPRDHMKLLEEALRYNPGKIDFLWGAAREDISHKRWKVVIDRCKEILSKQHDNVNAAKGLITAYSQLGDYRSARQVLEAALSMHRDNHTLYRYAGDLSREEGNYPEALEYLSRAMSMKGADEDFKLNVMVSMARVQKKMGNREVMRKLYKQILEVQPHHFAANLGLSKLGLQNGEYELSKRYANEAIHAKPKHGFAISLLGDIERAQGNYELALKEYQRALEVGREQAHTRMQVHALTKLANLMIRTNKKDLAYEYLQLAKGLEPNNEAIKARIIEVTK
jgi:tetratricopeptide (TPR) repeat protein